MSVLKTSGFNEEFVLGRIAASLEKELGMDNVAAKEVEQVVIARMIEWGLLKADKDDKFVLINEVSGQFIRAITAMVLYGMGMPEEHEKYSTIGMSTFDANMIDLGTGFGRHDNANQLEIPETAAKNKAAAISKKQYLNMLPREAVKYHQDGRIHIHDLDYFYRPFCRSHDMRYFFYYGFLPDGTGMQIAAAGPAKHADVAIQHAAKVMGTSQCLHSGGQGLLHFLTFMAPYFENKSYAEIKQHMQTFIYEMNQMLVARGGQSLSENELIVLQEDGVIRTETIGAFCKRYRSVVGSTTIHDKTILTPSVNRTTGRVEWKQVTGVTIHKPATKMMRTTLVDGRTVLTTTDHSLFALVNNKITEIKPSDQPKSIITSTNGYVRSTNVASIRTESYTLPFVYDISVADNENFILSNGILAHNTVFSSVNLTPGVPKIFRDVPAVYAGLRHDGVQAPLRTYGEFEREVRLGFMAVFEILREGDHFGRPFFFPKPEVTVDWEFVGEGSDKPVKFAHYMIHDYRESKNTRMTRPYDDGAPTLGEGQEWLLDTLETVPSYQELYELAFAVSAEQGATYFENHLVDPPTDKKQISCFQCCAYRFSKGEEDSDFFDQLTFNRGKHFSMGAYQVVSINMAQCAINAQYDDDRLLKEIHDCMDAAIEIFQAKRKMVSQIKHQLGFLLQTPPDPVTGKPGEPYTQLSDLSWDIGVVGVNEMVQHHTGYQIHESARAKELADQVMSDMFLYAKERSEDTGMKIAVARTPAETTAQRFAVMGLKSKYYHGQYENIVKGDVFEAFRILEEDPHATDLPIYLSNGFSTHVGATHQDGTPLSVDERASLEEFMWDAVAGGAMFQIYLGEERPDNRALADYGMKFMRNSRIRYVTFSPTFTYCRNCRNIHTALTDICPVCGSDQVEKIARITGYLSAVSSWNNAKKQELKERKVVALG